MIRNGSNSRFVTQTSPKYILLFSGIKPDWNLENPTWIHLLSTHIPRDHWCVEQPLVPPGGSSPSTATSTLLLFPELCPKSSLKKEQWFQFLERAILPSLKDEAWRLSPIFHLQHYLLQQYFCARPEGNIPNWTICTGQASSSFLLQPYWAPK